MRKGANLIILMLVFLLMVSTLSKDVFIILNYLFDVVVLFYLKEQANRK